MALHTWCIGRIVDEMMFEGLGLVSPITCNNWMCNNWECSYAAAAAVSVAGLMMLLSYTLTLYSPAGRPVMLTDPLSLSCCSLCSVLLMVYWLWSSCITTIPAQHKFKWDCRTKSGIFASLFTPKWCKKIPLLVWQSHLRFCCVVLLNWWQMYTPLVWRCGQWIHHSLEHYRNLRPQYEQIKHYTTNHIN